MSDQLGVLTQDGDEHDFKVDDSESVWLEFANGVVIYLREGGKHDVEIEAFRVGDDYAGEPRDGTTLSIARKRRRR